MGSDDGAATRLAVWGDYVCPFCHLADAAVAQVEADLGIGVERRPFELRPPGVPLPDLERGPFRNAFEEIVRPLAARLGVEASWNGQPSRTRKAHEAAAFARMQGRFEDMHVALYRAYWAHGRDIGRIDVLTEIGAGIGLDPLALRVALDVDAHTQEVRAAGAAAASLGIRAVPAYRLGDVVRTGLQEPEALRSWVAGRGNG